MDSKWLGSNLSYRILETKTIPLEKMCHWARRTNGMKEYSISMKLYRWCFCFISTLDLFYFLSFFKFHLMDWDLRIRQRHRYGQWHISCGRERGKGKGERGKVLGFSSHWYIWADFWGSIALVVRIVFFPW